LNAKLNLPSKNHASHLEAEHQLMPFKYAGTRVVIYLAHDGIDHVSQTILKSCILLRGRQRILEYIQEAIQ